MPDILTSHNAHAYAVERGLLERLVHYVDGRPLVGGAGYSLDGMLAESYRREAIDLMADIASLWKAMQRVDEANHTENGGGDAVALRRRLLDLVDALVPGQGDPVAVVTGEPVAFTADYSNGGRPIADEQPAAEIPDPPEPDLMAEAEAVESDATAEMAAAMEGGNGKRGRRS